MNRSITDNSDEFTKMLLQSDEEGLEETYSKDKHLEKNQVEKQGNQEIEIPEDEDMIPDDILDYDPSRVARDKNLEKIMSRIPSSGQEEPTEEDIEAMYGNPHNSGSVSDPHENYDKYRNDSSDPDLNYDQDSHDEEFYEDEESEDEEENYEDEEDEKYSIKSVFTIDENDGEEVLDIDSVINIAIERGASDIFIQPNKRITFKILGEIQYYEEQSNVDPIDVKHIMDREISFALVDSFSQTRELDTAYRVKSGKYAGRRLRLNVSRSFNEPILTYRTISDRIPSPDEIGLEDELLEWAQEESGVFLMCGKTGTGKTTTTASILENIRVSQRKHILTIEKPIEFEYKIGGKSLVTQREVLTDTLSFSNAMDSAMRMAPDIILVGEIRNAVEVDQLIRASESGHLSISTMHTSTPHGTIQRIAGIYSDVDRRRVLASLSQEAVGFANQLLIKSVDGKSRFGLRELMTVTNEVSDYIAAGDTKSIKNYQIRRKATMEHKLVQAYRDGRCLREAAYRNANDKELFEGIERGEY